eukprot:GHRR01014568.1.p1 GENE.GHRR01014568.1~~GHRR01014568.1.p1  ORF type:complete len:100 (+),score=47.29 GHRR01014568.1:1491-1790(+)
MVAVTGDRRTGAQNIVRNKCGSPQAQRPEKNWQWRHYALNSGSSSWQRQCNGHTDDSSNQGSSSNQQLVINAGSGRVNLRAISWMDGLKAKLQAQQQQQ